MIKSNNLSDLTNKTEARKNLDVYGKSEVDAKIQNATPNIDLSGYARKEHTHTIGQITDLQTKLDDKLDKSEKDAPNGVAILENGALPNRYLPPSDVLVHWEKSTFPAQGDTKKIYFEQSTRKIYVYNGSAGYKEYTDHIGRTKSIPENTDLNTILEDGCFVSETNSKSATFSNTPIRRAFTLISYKSAGFIQEIIDYDLQSRWIRRYYNFLKNWSAWQEVPIAKQDISGKANLAGGNTFSGDQILNNKLYVDSKNNGQTPTISLAIGDGKTGFHNFDTGKFGLYANGQILQDFYQGHEPVCANGLGQYPTIKKMTKAQYDAIAMKENNVIYFITE